MLEQVERMKYLPEEVKQIWRDNANNKITAREMLKKLTEILPKYI